MPHPGHDAGLPTLARGTGVPARGFPRHGRVTHARAWNRAPSSSRSSLRPDHPRSRVEQDRTASVYLAALGSPTLARGTAAVDVACRRRLGITHARTWNRGSPTHRFRRGADHPRSRVERPFDRFRDGLIPGSPTLARGTVHEAHDAEPQDRITHARAWNKRSGPWAYRIRSDHPHSRVEQGRPRPNRDYRIGSPTLARGTGHAAGARASGDRITHAHAWNSTAG